MIDTPIPSQMGSIRASCPQRLRPSYASLAFSTGILVTLPDL